MVWNIGAGVCPILVGRPVFWSDFLAFGDGFEFWSPVRSVVHQRATIMVDAKEHETPAQDAGTLACASAPLTAFVNSGSDNQPS